MDVFFTSWVIFYKRILFSTNFIIQGEILLFRLFKFNTIFFYTFILLHHMLVALCIIKLEAQCATLFVHISDIA